ncbi:MAG: hypothetical protein ABI718_18165 [Acidobacteriota bacterium]
MSRLSSMMRFFTITLAVAALAIPSFAAGASSEALALVPADAATVGMVRLDELRSSPLSGRLFTEADKATLDGDTLKFMQDAGLDPRRDVDLVVMAVSPGTSPTDHQVLVQFVGRYDIARLSSAVKGRGAVATTVDAGTYFKLPENSDDGHHDGAVAFVDNGLVLAGTESAIVEALSARKNGGTNFRARSPLAGDIARIDPSATSWLVMDVPRSSRLTGGHQTYTGATSGPGMAIASAIKHVSVVTVWATDAGTDLLFGATAKSSDDETRQLLEDTVRGMLAAWRLTVQDKAPQLVSIIRQFEVKRDGDSVSLSGKIPAEMLKTLATTHHSTMAK